MHHGFVLSRVPHERARSWLYHQLQPVPGMTSLAWSAPEPNLTSKLLNGQTLNRQKEMKGQELNASTQRSGQDRETQNPISSTTGSMSQTVNPAWMNKEHICTRLTAIAKG
mmetsp:Transcript_125606/g.217810  ORF Transcript_125606/g.217810 Transcript_125606/m.217810 type:complete len:111 (-) Transcript_125606:1373-1705(-)